MPPVIVSDYSYGDESKEFSYFRIPRLLISHARFKNVSVEAKLQYARHDGKLAALKKTGLTPGYLIRHADDFVIITDSRTHAEEWKSRLQIFLQEKMKLTLSAEKTLITDIRKKCIKFLGYQFKMSRGKARRGYICKTSPDADRLKRKVEAISESIKRIPNNYSKEQLITEINRINSQTRGVIQYYQRRPSFTGQLYFAANGLPSAKPGG